MVTCESRKLRSPNGAPLFWRVNIANPFFSFDQQIDKLTVDKGLLIPDRDYAIAILKKTSYFALICAYKDPFMNTTTGRCNTRLKSLIEKRS